MSKSRVSLTIENDLLKRIDKETEKRSKNRSQLIEDIIKQYFNRKGLNTAVVLCGDKENKTLDLYEGKPVLSHILEQLRKEGIKRAILLVGKNKQDIEPHFGSDHKDMVIEYIEEKKLSGSGNALKKAENKIDETFLALNGHVISDVDLQDMLETHRSQNSIASLALTTVENPSNYGVAKLKGNKIKGFEEKPSPGQEPSRLINAGTYILEPSIFDILNGYSELNELFKELTSKDQLTGYIYGGEWKDIRD